MDKISTHDSSINLLINGSSTSRKQIDSELYHFDAFCDKERNSLAFQFDMFRKVWSKKVDRPRSNPMQGLKKMIFGFTHYYGWSLCFCYYYYYSEQPLFRARTFKLTWKVAHMTRNICAKKLWPWPWTQGHRTIWRSKSDITYFFTFDGRVFKVTSLIDIPKCASISVTFNLNL